MGTLLEKIQTGMTDEERCDILLSLTGRIADGMNIANGPEEVEVGEDSQIHILRLNGGDNMALWPPEMIRAVRDGGAAGMGEQQAFFVLGMLAYWIYYKTDYYLRSGKSPMDQERLIAGKSCVIAPEEAGEIPFGGAVSQLTAVDPAAREAGVAAFLSYLSTNMPGRVQICYICSGTPICTQVRTIYRDIENLSPNGDLVLNGTAYRLASDGARIPYRPGTHRYEVPVLRADGPGGGTAPPPGPGNRQITIVGRWLCVDRPALVDSPGGVREETRLLALNGRDGSCSFQMQDPDCRLLICESGNNGGSRVLRDIPLLNGNAARQEGCTVQASCQGGKLRITVLNGQDGMAGMQIIGLEDLV